MTAMGLKPGQMMQVGNEQVEATAHFGDAMAYALTQSNMNRESFFEALKYSAPIAATAGLSAGEEIAANMIVANSGLKGSMAGTGMRSGLLTLAGANKKAQAALEEVGVTGSDAQKQMAEAEATFNQLGVTGKSFSQRVMQLGQAFSQMSGDEQLNYAYRICDNTRTELEYLNSAFDALQGAGISGGLTAAANAARMFGAAMLTAARAALAFVVTPVGAVLTAPALAAYYAYENWERVAPAISRVADIFNLITPAVDNAKNALSTFADAFHFDALTSGFGNLIDMLGEDLHKIA